MSAPMILVVIPDLMFQTRVREQAKALDYDVIVADAQVEVSAALEMAPKLVVLDLHAYGMDPAPIIEAAKALDVPVLAFGRHTAAGELKAAREAGCDRVVVRSTFVEEMPQLLQELVGSKTSTDPR